MSKYLPNPLTIVSVLAAVLLFATMLPKPATAQDNRLDIEFIKLFNALQQDLPRERVYLHTDRQWYFYGDRIWFSAYVTAGALNAPSMISKVVYVELYSPEGELIERTAIENEDGRGHGSIVIENAGEPGIYKLKAYTAWGLNFGGSYSHVFEFPVHTGDDSSIAEYSNDFHVGFYPEGGDLVAGLESRAGFKSIGSDGLGVDISGIIYDQDRNQIAEIETRHLGMGDFTFTPEPGQNYHAMINGKRFDLPEARPEGIVFGVNENEYNQFHLDLRSSDNQDNREYLVFAHVRGEIYLATTIDLMDGRGFTVAPKSMFATGPVHFTVLTRQGAPLAERLVFNINETDIIRPSITADNDIYSLRDRVDLTISIHDADDEHVNAYASLSVFDDGLDTYNLYASNIRTKMLLESDIAGNVENPGYYFSDSENLNKHADLLMLTQGWRAFDMNEVQQIDEINLFSMPEDGIRLSGQIRSAFRGRGLEDATVVFSVGANQDDMQIINTDEDGYFTITDLYVTGSQAINIRANDSDGNDNVRIRLSEPFSHLPGDTSRIGQSSYSVLSMLKEGAQAGSGALQEELTERADLTRMQTEEFADAQMRGELEEVVVAGERITEDQQERDLRLASPGSQRVDLDERTALASLSVDLIVNQMSGVSANINGLSINTGASSFTGPIQPLVILDGIESDWNTVQQISTADIQTINVFRRATELAAWGARGNGGVLVVHTRRGAGASPSTRGFTTAFVQGYQTPTRFYSPRYGFTVPVDTEEKDSRITLHWEPELNIEGSDNLFFWTNDIPSTYRVVIEGITDFGIPFTETIQLSAEN